MAVASTISQNASSTPSTFTPPYPPSWLDRLTAWVARLPGPSWLYYIGTWAIFYVALTLVQWREGGYPVGTLNGFHLVTTGSGMLLLLLARYLNRTAARALTNARPLLNLGALEFQELTYRLTTLPARAAFVASWLPLLFAVPNLAAPETIFREAHVALTPLSIALTLFFSVLLSFCAGAVLYQMYRQMRLVNFIYRECAHVDLFRLSPLYGFSRLTAQASSALILLATAFYVSDPTIVSDPANVFTGIFGLLLCVAVFIVPLLGAHNRIVAEKERLLDETTQRIQSTIATLHGEVDSVHWSDATNLKDILTALDLERAAR